MDADAPAPEPVTPPRATLPLPTDDLRPASEGGPPSPEREAPRPAEPVVARGLVPQQLLDPDAVFVVRRLQRSGQEAYVVGGCVRDLLAGLEPKDFDVATDAHPSRIKRLFHGARVIGRRFRLVHIRFPGEHVIETSTFRGDPERLAREAAAAGESVDAWMERHGAENFFGTAPEDARRRDFTINALFYDPLRDEVIDWVGGLRDLEQRVVRSIGDPDRRLAEDPVRMIRAVHFAERLGFSIEPELLAAIERNAARIADASQARLYVELQKVVSRGRARNSFHRLWELRVLEAWIPELSAYLDHPMAWPQEAGGTHAEASRGEPSNLPAAHATWNLLAAADRWGLAARRAPESLQMAVLFGSWLLETWRMEREEGRGSDFFPAFAEHMERVFRPVALRMSIPRWVSARLTDVLWMLLELRSPPQPRRRRTFARAGFSEALALLEMDLAARDAGPELLEQWIAAAEDAGANLELAATGQARAETLDQLPPDQRRRRRGGRSRRPRRGFADTPEPLPGEPHSGRRAEADAWAPAPEADEDPPPPYAGPAPSPQATPPPPAPRPMAAPPVAPPREAPREIPRPRSPLADDDFASGIL